MQNYCKTLGALAAASALVAGNANAEVEYEIHAGYSSMYLFRGLDLGDNLTEMGVDAATEFNGFTLSGGLWATAFDQDRTANKIDSEIDFYTEVSKDLGFMTASVGYIYYWNLSNTSGGVDDQEVYFSVSRDFGFAEAYLTYFWDVIENGGGNNGYSELGLSRAFELNQCVKLNVGSNLGYLVEQGQATAFTTKVSLDWGFAEKATVSPFVAYSIALSDDIDTAYNSSENEFVAGSMLKVGF